VTVASSLDDATPTNRSKKRKTTRDHRAVPRDRDESIARRVSARTKVSKRRAFRLERGWVF